ncbi:TPA: Fic family protein, partial [Neisseria meningitidis]
LKTTHSLISENLLEKGSGGVVRRDSVTISGTDYTPLSNPQSLDTELKWLLQEAPKIENPFDRAVYLHNNLAYLQYFKDCNKRTARNCMTLSLMRSGFFPCVFSPDSYPAYAEAVVAYYETGDYGLFKKYFISAYENTVNKYGPQPDMDISRNFSL